MNNVKITFIKNVFLNPCHYLKCDRIAHYLKTSFLAKFADFINKTSNTKITGGENLVVSLTSHGHRIAQVHRTIESIGRGRIKPSRLILWLNHEEKGNPLPESLKRLCRRGLEIHYTDDYGSHKKYYPYVISISRHAYPMLTADDDLWYPQYWMERLWKSYQTSPEHVHCYHANIAKVKNGMLLPY
jgi:hypothetical protein